MKSHNGSTKTRAKASKNGKPNGVPNGKPNAKRNESLLATSGNTLRGRPQKERPKTFVLYESELKLVSRLTAFRRICSILCECLPAAKPGDTVLLHKPQEHLDGEAEILDVKHITCGDGTRKSALAVVQIDETEVSYGG